MLSLCDSATVALYEELAQEIEKIGRDIEHYDTDRLKRFKRGKVFACLRPIPTAKKIHVWVRLDPKQQKIIPGFTRDMSKIKRDAGGCELEIAVGSQQQLKKALVLCRKAYREQKPVSSPRSRTSNHLDYMLSNCGEELLKLFDDFTQAIVGLGNDVSQEDKKILRQFRKRGKVFVCLRPYPRFGKVQAWVSLDPEREKLIDGFTRNTTGLGSWAPSHCKLRITAGRQELQEAISICRKAYAEARS